MSENRNHNEGTGLEIAVIGMAGRFPGAANIHEFWENLENGRESITFFSQQESTEEGVDGQEPEHPAYVRARGILAGVENFEPAFFKLTPGEAEIMDPQLRIFLECSWQALEDAGYNPEDYDGDIGIYAGNAVNHYWIAKTLFSRKSYLLGRFKTELLTTHFSMRLSYHLNLKGPSITVQTACSTSLVAIHSACLGLLSSECDMALAGGVSLSLPQKTGYLFQEGMVNSPDGHCRAFDARAKGSAAGSGAGVVILKKLEDATADRDHIYALIKGTAINNDGMRKVGYTAPSVQGQAHGIQAAYLVAEVEPETVSYIETHGTATELGDPVEIEALKMVFHKAGKKTIPIGSVKTNVGHLDTAAGVTGFIKTVLALKHRQIPPSLHFETPNPKIDFESSPFYVNTQLKTWENHLYPLRAGVSSFGLGGTNAHAILEAAPPLARKQVQETGEYRLLLLSARTAPALQRMTENLQEYFKINPGINLKDAAYTLQKGRKHFKYRKAVLFSTPAEAAERLGGKSKKVKTFRSETEEPGVFFLLSGQGSQYDDMGADLYRKVKHFRDEVNRCLEIAKSSAGSDIKGGIIPVFIFGYALAGLLMKWGVKPTAMIGYSMGEYIAAALSGVISLEDALKLLADREQLLEKTATGAMISVPLPWEEFKPLLESNSGIYPAILNGPTTVVAGTAAAVAALEKQMKEKRLLCAPINISHAIHSPLVEPIRQEFENRLKEIKLNGPIIPYISNVTGNRIITAEAVDPAYWGKHLCTTVRFSEGIKELLKQENTVFIEIGPGRLLSNIVRYHVPAGKENKYKIVNTIKHQQEKVTDDYYLLSKIGEMWLYGISIDWDGYYEQQEETPARIPLPVYPFEKKGYWIDEDPFKRLGEWPARPGENQPFEEPEPESLQSPGSEPGEYEDQEYEAPRDELEQAVARLWQEFLGFARIGIQEDFFDINGDSLTATLMVTRLQQLYPVEISLQQFFENPTIASQARLIKELLAAKIKEFSEEELDELAESMNEGE